MPENPLNETSNQPPQLSRENLRSASIGKTNLSCLYQQSSTRKQISFMSGRSTTQQLLQLNEYISEFDRNLSTANGFLDMIKAYDPMWHTRLLYWLIKIRLLSGSKFVQSTYWRSGIGVP